MFLVFPDRISEPAICKCCGKTTQSISGWIEDSEKTVAAYLIQWTLASKEHDANFDLIFGGWGDQATPNDRSVASFIYSYSENGFMVIDSHTRPAGQSNEVASFPLARNDIIGTPLATYLYGLLDAIWIQDSRIADIREGGI